MNREELILKWLDNNLNDQELKAFKNLEDYDDLVKLNNNLQTFKADNYDTSKQLENVLSAIKSKKQTPVHWFKPLMRIAAILAVCFSLYYYTTTLDTKISTEFAQKTTIKLPDASRVSLNAKTSLAFNKKDWKHERALELHGEAFFKVNALFCVKSGAHCGRFTQPNSSICELGDVSHNVSIYNT